MEASASWRCCSGATCWPWWEGGVTLDTRPTRYSELHPAFLYMRHEIIVHLCQGLSKHLRRVLSPCFCFLAMPPVV